MTLLSNRGIRRYMDHGSVVIDPFRPERLNTDGYDLELGPHFWRYRHLLRRAPATMARGQGFDYVDARADGGIWLAANERVLGHSVEVAGGRLGRRSVDHVRGGEEAVAVTTHLQGTSTAARHGITACMCAGYGDVGFVNIWTFEIENRTRDELWLPVGAIIAQIAFTKVEVPDGVYGDITGNYAPADAVSPDDIRASWSPMSMLPKPLKTRDGWREYWPQPDEKG